MARLPRLIAVLSLCGTAVAAAAESGNDSLPVYYLDEIVVTATRYELALRDISATVSVVTEDDIEALNARNFANALAHVPGVHVNRTGAFGRADIDIRGIGDRGRSVMVLIDGRPVKMGLYGCTITHSLPMDNVARIEVVRGPASVLYGSDALGGVINIITKKADEPVEGDLTVSQGSFRTGQYRLRVGSGLDRMDLYATADVRTSDGHVDNAAYDGKDFSGRAGYSINSNVNGVLTARYFDGYKEEPLRTTDPDTAFSDVWNDYRRWAFDLTVTGEWPRDDAMLKVYRNAGEHEFSDGWHSRDHTNGFMSQWSRAFAIGNKITAGGDFRQQGGERVGIDSVPWSKYEYGLFVHDEQILFDRVILTCGLRYNIDEIAGRVFVPQFGAVAHLAAGATLKAGANKGFRSPQINELYLFPPSNTDLEPEIVWNYEVGLNQRIVPGLNIEATGFVMRGLNFIELVPNPSAPPPYVYANVGTFQFRGFEAGIIARHRDRMTAQLYYTYLDPQERTTGRPRHRTSALVTTSQSAFALSVSGEYVTGYYAADSAQDPIDDYYVVNTKLAYTLPFGLQPFIAIDNITDEQYEVYANLPGTAAGLYRMPPRSFTVGVKYAFP